MSSLFRLRYYLRRSTEKQPLLLLEPILLSGLGPTWYLYSEGGLCAAVELRKLHALHKLQELRQELRALHQRQGHELGLEQEGLAQLWQANIKGIALRQLAQGQIIATEGAWLVSERSFYALLPHTCDGEQNVELRATGLGARGVLLGLWQSGKMQICRLNLERRSLISMKQALPSGRSLYSLSWGGKRSDIFLFAPASSVESGQALRQFLPPRPAESFVAGFQLEHLEDLAANFAGWGEARGEESGEWARLGGWRIRQKLLQKYTVYIQRRAAQFGGYPIPALVRELAEKACPPALAQSLLAALPEKNTFCPGVFCKVDGHLLAKEGMYDPARPIPPQISPQGSKMLQDLARAGQDGLLLQGEASQALLRSGWAVQRGLRCYARNTVKLAEAPREYPEKSQPPERSLEKILANYRKKNQQRQAATKLPQILRNFPPKKFTKNSSRAEYPRNGRRHRKQRHYPARRPPKG